MSKSTSARWESTARVSAHISAEILCANRFFTGFPLRPHPHQLSGSFSTSGACHPKRNLEILPTMMASLAVDASAQYHLLLAGDGRRAAWFREIADRTALGRIHLLGHVADREYLADLYPNCDALVHPNAREPFGITPLEAMASGLPVVAPRAGGVLSYADDGNAWPVKPAGEDFAAGVRAAFANEAARSAKVERAIRTAAKLDWSHVAASFFDLYNGL
jgi:glycosyltransferase involved in cell wall biosynthesis